MRRFMVKQIGTSISPFAVIAIWECEKCHNNWTSSDDAERCPYCHSVRLARIPKKWVPFFLSRNRTRLIGWKGALTLGLVAWGGATVLYVFNQYTSPTRSSAFRQRFVARRHQDRHVSDEKVEPVKTEWEGSTTAKS
jgi:hypothetical protein